jgi:hypothetical protein
VGLSEDQIKLHDGRALTFVLESLKSDK